jgi:hypothetical protein
VGKAARNRRLRDIQHDQAATAEENLRRRGHTGPMPADTPATRKLMAQILGETDMPCRATFIDSLFAGAGTVAPVAGITDEGQPVHDLSGPADRIPVMMFEPERLVAAEDPVTGRMYDFRTEALVSNGFTRVPPMAMLAAMPVDGWELRRTEDGAVLFDPYAGTVAEGHLGAYSLPSFH